MASGDEFIINRAGTNFNIDGDDIFIYGGGFTSTAPVAATDELIVYNGGTPYNDTTRDVHIGGTYGVRTDLTSTQTITDATPLIIDWDAEVDDDGNMWVIGNPSRLTAPDAAWYTITGGIVVQSTTYPADSWIRLRIRLNGSTYIASQLEQIEHSAGVRVELTVSTQYKLSASDYVELEVEVDRGTDSTLDDDAETFFAMVS